MAKINKILANGNEYDSWATNADVTTLSTSVTENINEVKQLITETAGNMTLMSDDEKEPALEDLLSQLN